jgi:quercetin dioxygenase-like cupin family protein
MLPGIVRRAVHLEHTMMTFFNFEPGSIVPEHEHPHEQITYVVQGGMEFTLGGETRILRAGQGICCPPGVSHGGVILDEPTVAVDAWYPVREEYA